MSPFLFVILIFIGIIKCRQGNKKTAGIFLWTALILIYLLSIRPVKNLLVGPLENIYPAGAVFSGDVLIIPGGGVLEKSPENNNKALLTDSSLRRCLAGFFYWKKLKIPIIVSGGTPLASGTPEAVAMADFLKRLGIPKKYLLIEVYSRNTYENILNSYRLMQNRRWQTAGLVTSALHMPRTVRIAQKLKVNYKALPTAYLSDRTPYHYYDFIPSAPDLSQSLAALHEYIGIAYYKLRYRI